MARRCSLTPCCLAALLGAACADDPPPVLPAFSPPDMVALHRSDDLRRATELLHRSNCVPTDTRATLLAALPPPGQRSATDFSAALERHAAAVCPAGARLLHAAAVAPVLLLFEGQRILVDLDADRCHDAIYLLEQNLLDPHDADGNGCFDRLWAVENVRSFPSLPGPVRDHLLARVDFILTRVLPAPPERARLPGFDARAYRAEASAALLELREWVEAEPTFPAELRVIYSGFLRNNLLFTEEWVPCNNPAQAAPAPAPMASTGPLRFYVYTSTAPHGWKSLAVGENEWRRGLYPTPAGAGLPAARADVPDAASAPTAAPVAAPPGPGSPSSSEEPSNGSAWGSELAGEDASSVTTGAFGSSGFVTGLFNYQQGVIRDEARRADWTSRICWEVTAEEWDVLAAHMNGETGEPPDWNLVNHNCLSWAANNAALIGRRLPDYTTVGIPNPIALDESLRGLGHGGEFAGGTVSLPGR